MALPILVALGGYVVSQRLAIFGEGAGHVKVK